MRNCKLDTDLFDSLNKALQIYSKKYDNISHELTDTGYLIKKYSPGGYFNWHDDQGSNNISRCLSVIWYLNDNYQNGELQFKYLDLKIKPEQNMMVIFPSHFIYTHRGCLVKSGNKYIVTTFMIKNPPLS